MTPNIDYKYILVFILVNFVKERSIFSYKIQTNKLSFSLSDQNGGINGNMYTNYSF